MKKKTSFIPSCSGQVLLLATEYYTWEIVQGQSVVVKIINIEVLLVVNIG
jgi:hypothetical protein